MTGKEHVLGSQGKVEIRLVSSGSDLRPLCTDASVQGHIVLLLLSQSLDSFNLKAPAPSIDLGTGHVPLQSLGPTPW